MCANSADYRSRFELVLAHKRASKAISSQTSALLAATNAKFRLCGDFTDLARFSLLIAALNPHLYGANENIITLLWLKFYRGSGL